MSELQQHRVATAQLLTNSLKGEMLKPEHSFQQPFKIDVIGTVTFMGAEEWIVRAKDNTRARTFSTLGELIKSLVIKGGK